MLVCSYIHCLNLAQFLLSDLQTLKSSIGLVPDMGLSYPELGTFSAVAQLCVVVSFSCSSCIVSVLPFWYAGKLGKLSELNAENNMGS